MNKIGVLWILGGIMGNGGTESFLMNYFRNLNHDLFQIDFVVHGYGKGVFDEEIKAAGSKIYHIPVKSRNYLQNRNSLIDIFSSKNYSIVHSHMNAMNTPVLKLAYKCNIPVRISHAHTTDHQIFSNNLFDMAKRILGEYARVQSAEYSTHMLACSTDAATWLFGEYNVDIGRVTVLPNAIDTDKFIFNMENRELMRKKLNISDNYVIGHVGRFDPSKNHQFLLEVFEQLLEKKPESKLLLIGDGNSLKSIIAKASEKHIEDKIIFTGAKTDLPKYLHAMDIFVLPSKFEGLGISLIEAQAAGLPCIASNDVPKEADVTDNVTFIPLREPIDVWVDKIINTKLSTTPEHANDLVKQNGYNINLQAKYLENFYLECLK